MLYRNTNQSIMDIQDIKKMHNLQGKEVYWAVIEEITASHIKYKPALAIKDSKLFFDLLARRFYSSTDLPELGRHVFKAKKVDLKDQVAFVAEDDNQKQVVLPSSFLDDVYLPAWYEQDLENQILL